MVVCKYFQQGNCRFGQYCRYEHTNGFGTAPAAQNKNYNDGKSLVFSVAEEVLTAERGGQWLLSCFGPFKEQGCIPGMEDVSPEEVRWEMYEAQKNGTVEQTKLQFQQLCQAMTTKRDALKHPTHETAAMLEKLQKTNRDSNFVLCNSQLGGSMTETNIFASQKFNSQASGGFSDSFNSNSNSQSIFGKIGTNNASVFGGKSSFGAFTQQNQSNSIFGNNSTATTSVFGIGTTAPPTTVSSQTNSSSFSTTNNQNLFNNQPQQQNNIFSNTQTVSVFGGGSTTSNNSPFSNVSNNSLPLSFGNNQQGGNIFGGNTIIQPTGSSIFSGNTTGTLGNQKTVGSTSIFGSSVFNNPNPQNCNPGNHFASDNYGLLGSTTSNITPNIQNSMSFQNCAPPISENNSFATPFDNSHVTVSNSNPFAAAAINNPTVNETEKNFQSQILSGQFQQNDDQSVYTSPEDLSEDDKTFFLAKTFSLTKIPINPPTIELR